MYLDTSPLPFVPEPGPLFRIPRGDSDAQLRELATTRQFVIEDGLRHENRGENVSDQADCQCYRKSADRPFPKKEKEGAGYHRGHVGVDDGPPCLAEAIIDGGNHALAGAQLLADAFENQHIRIHRHTDGQDDSGDTGQGQNRMEIRDGRQQNDGIEHQRQHRIDARALVVHQHDRDHRHQSGETGDDALMDRIGAQRGSDGALLVIDHARGQRTGTQVARQIDAFLFTAQAGDAAGVLDFGLNGGHADDLVVEDDGELIADVGFRVAAEAASAILGEAEIGFPLAEFILAGTRVAHLAAGDDRDLDEEEPLLAVLCPTRFGANQFGAHGQDAALLGQSPFLAGEWTFLDVADFEHGGGADEFLGAGWIVHAGQLHQHFVLGTGLAVLLHGFLGQSEFVDTGADGVHGALHGIHLEIGEIRRLQLERIIGGVEGGQDVGGIALGDETAEGAGLGGGYALDGEGHILGIFHFGDVRGFHTVPGDVLLFEVFLEALGGLIGIRLDRVLHLDFENQVGAALEIETEPDVVAEIPGEVRAALGKSDDAEHADQHGDDDDHG